MHLSLHISRLQFVISLLIFQSVYLILVLRTEIDCLQTFFLSELKLNSPYVLINFTTEGVKIVHFNTTKRE
jgi:hypothetical protein